MALQQFHQFRTVFSGTVRPDGLAGFSLPWQHSLVHYHDNIKKFGSPNGLCSSITESKHIVVVKHPWRRSSRYQALSQILKINERLDKLAAAKADFTSRGMLDGSSLVAAIFDALGNTDCADDDDQNDDGSDDMDDRGGDGMNNGDEGVSGVRATHSLQLSVPLRSPMTPSLFY